MALRHGNERSGYLFCHRVRLISGGPNKRFPYTATREKLGEDTPPAKYFLDETPSADTNEIAIYWNSPAIFVGAYLNSLTLK